MRSGAWPISTHQLPEDYQDDIRRMGYHGSLGVSSVTFWVRGNFTVAEFNNGVKSGLGVAKRNPEADENIPTRGERIALCRAVQDFINGYSGEK